MELGLDGKVAFVTGATCAASGVPSPCACTPTRAAWSVCARAMRARSPPPAGELRALGRAAHGVVADVTDEASLTAAVDEVASALGGLDLVVANAGGAAGGSALEDASGGQLEPDARARREYTQAVLLRAALPHLRARGGGAAVLIASVSGMKPQPRAQYAAAKAAEIHLAHTLVRELGPHGIRVNAVSPARSSFEGGSWGAASRGRGPEGRSPAWVEHEFPLGRLGTPKEVADVAAFLLWRGQAG